MIYLVQKDTGVCLEWMSHFLQNIIPASVPYIYDKDYSFSLFALHSYGWRTIRIIFLAYICKLFLLKTSLQHIKLKHWNVRWQKEAQPCHMPSLYGSMTLPWLFFCPSFGKSFTSPYSSDSFIFLFNSSLKWE